MARKYSIPGDRTSRGGALLQIGATGRAEDDGGWRMTGGEERRRDAKSAIGLG
jgi:hypothetical protein